MVRPNFPALGVKETAVDFLKVPLKSCYKESLLSDDDLVNKSLLLCQPIFALDSVHVLVQFWILAGDKNNNTLLYFHQFIGER